MRKATPLQIARRVNRGVRQRHARVEAVGRAPFGDGLELERFRLGNGLDVVILVDPVAPVVSYQTWFRVGSRHERPGKTGLAHLFEHLMFKETKNTGPGEFDRRMEEAGAETNAATWTDWTFYYENLPRAELELAARLESDRLANLVLDDARVAAEKDVVANERRYSVEDDVEGAASEKLWAKAFTKHPYRWPTIGWMRDIRAFTLQDCLGFYRTWYAPNNATLVVAGDVEVDSVLELVQRYYGALPPSRLPRTAPVAEPAQRRPRRLRLTKPTDTEKLGLGYHAPAFGDPAHATLVVLAEILSGGRSSRLHRALVTEHELATDVSCSLTPFRDPGLFTIWASARPRKGVASIGRQIDAQLDRLREEPVPGHELEKAKNRIELSFLSGMETAGGKAEQIGFHATVLDDPGTVFDRLERYRRVSAEELGRAARRWLSPSGCTRVEVLPARRGRRPR